MSSDFTIAILGAGLIGGSLGMAWRRAGVARTVLGADPDPGALEAAVKLGAIDRAVTLEEALSEADLLVIAAPVREIIRLAGVLGPRVRPGQIVTDVGSTKAEIVAAWDQHLGEGAQFVGGHPIFGREVSGVANAAPELPVGCRYVLTPGRTSSEEAVVLVSRLAAGAGAQPVVMAPDQHDQAVALISHLPQLVASALAAATAGDPALNLSGSGLRDTTRLADSPASLWSDIFATNRAAVTAAVQRFRALLGDLEAAVESGDSEAFEQIFEQARAARQRMKER